MIDFPVFGPLVVLVLFSSEGLAASLQVWSQNYLFFRACCFLECEILSLARRISFVLVETWIRSKRLVWRSFDFCLAVSAAVFTIGVCEAILSVLVPFAVLFGNIRYIFWGGL